MRTGGDAKLPTRHMYVVIDRNRAPPKRRPTSLHNWHAARAQRRGRLQKWTSAGPSLTTSKCRSRARNLQAAAHRPLRRGRTLGIVLDMRAQFRDRAEAHGPVRKLGLDGTIRIERIGHAIDNARLEDRD